MTMDALHYYGSYNIYYSAWADYVDGSVFGIEFLNFESTGSSALLVLAGKG